MLFLLSLDTPLTPAKEDALALVDGEAAIYSDTAEQLLGDGVLHMKELAALRAFQVQVRVTALLLHENVRGSARSALYKLSHASLLKESVHKTVEGALSRQGNALPKMRAHSVAYLIYCHTLILVAGQKFKQELFMLGIVRGHLPSPSEVSYD